MLHHGFESMRQLLLILLLIGTSAVSAVPTGQSPTLHVSQHAGSPSAKLLSPVNEKSRDRRHAEKDSGFYLSLGLNPFTGRPLILSWNGDGFDITTSLPTSSQTSPPKTTSNPSTSSPQSTSTYAVVPPLTTANEPQSTDTTSETEHITSFTSLPSSTSTFRSRTGATTIDTASTSTSSTTSASTTSTTSSSTSPSSEPSVTSSLIPAPSDQAISSGSRVVQIGFNSDAINYPVIFNSDHLQQMIFTSIPQAVRSRLGLTNDKDQVQTGPIVQYKDDQSSRSAAIVQLWIPNMQVKHLQGLLLNKTSHASNKRDLDQGQKLLSLIDTSIPFNPGEDGTPNPYPMKGQHLFADSSDRPGSFDPSGNFIYDVPKNDILNWSHDDGDFHGQSTIDNSPDAGPGGSNVSSSQVKGSSVPIPAGVAGGALLIAAALFYILRRRNQDKIRKHQTDNDEEKFESMSIDDGGHPDRNGLRKSAWNAHRNGDDDRDDGCDSDSDSGGVYGYSGYRR